MTRDELNNRYFDWMYKMVCHKKRGRPLYLKLLQYLHTIEFTYTIDMDGNRAEDGVNLRYRFGYDCNIDSRIVASDIDCQPCSVLEVIVALAHRMEESIMADPEYGDRTGCWFWAMMASLGISLYDDNHFDKRSVEEKIVIFLNRDYCRDGRGGLFTIRDSTKDMRTTEIWYQMCWYLREIIN